MSLGYSSRAARAAAFGFVALLVSAPAFAACGAAPTASVTDGLLHLKSSGDTGWFHAVEDAGSVVEGDFVYDGTNKVVAFCNGTSWIDVAAAGGSATLNGITAATANQAGINNAAYTIVWNWNTLTTGTALTIASASMTTGSLLNLSNTNGANSGGVVLTVSNAEDANGAAAIYGSESGATHAVYGVEGAIYISTSGAGAGVYGAAGGGGPGAGVLGYNYSATGVVYGVSGQIISTTDHAAAVQGTTFGTTGATYGVYGSDSSATGYGGYFTNTNGGYALATGSGNVGIGTTSPAAVLDVVGTAKLGSAGTAMTAMGVGTVASYTPTNAVANKTCTGVPASSSVAVHCSPSAAFTTPITTVIIARATGTVDQLAVSLTVANAVAVSLTCMWVEP